MDRRRLPRKYKLTREKYEKYAKYKIPKELPRKILTLALVACYIEVDVSELERSWKFFVPHPKSRALLCLDLMRLHDKGDIKRVGRGRYRLTKTGLKKLRYYDKKVGLPEVIRNRIKVLLEKDINLIKL
ncbi:MAG: hypothetical protein DRO98_01670 [Archaeoglobales archaeon]|nr:MAG: hypothetical protein DRO98_01670 [Archaeoglobales archaeon]